MQSASLFIETESEDDTARGLEVLFEQRFNGRHDCNQATLVVGASTPPHSLAIKKAGERRVSPLIQGIGIDRDNVWIITKPSTQGLC